VFLYRYQTLIINLVLPHASASSVPTVHDWSISDPHVGTFERGGKSFGLGRDSGAGSNDSEEGGQSADGGALPPNFWTFNVDHERLERDIQHLRNADLDAISQLPPNTSSASSESLLPNATNSLDIKPTVPESSKTHPSPAPPACFVAPSAFSATALSTSVIASSVVTADPVATSNQ
jgi:hypothetical protein